jgi:hypothetical protein
VAHWRKLLIRLQGCWGRVAWKGVGDLGRQRTRSSHDEEHEQAGEGVR